MLIDKKYRCMLWKDDDVKTEMDVFLLTKYAEIFEYSEKELGLYVWSREFASWLRKSGVNSEDRWSDDPFNVFRANKALLPQIMQLGAYKRRPHITGDWVRSREEILGHRVLPTNISSIGYVEKE